MNNQPQNLNAAVLAALEKLKSTNEPDALTLEEVMACFYRRPCRRVSPGTNPRFNKYGRGSVLVYKDEVVLILLPEDNTLTFPCRKTKCVGPRSRYKGVEPRSRIYTKTGILVCVAEPFTTVTEIRKFFTELSEHCRENYGVDSFLGRNSAGHLNNHRCPEAFVLYGRIVTRELIEFLGSEVVPDPGLF